jgi:hypothetical protein
MPGRRCWVLMPGPHCPVRHDLAAAVPMRQRILVVLAATAVGIGLAQAQDAGQEPDLVLSRLQPCAPAQAGRRHGTAEIEQGWIDFTIIDKFNWRAPGIDLVRSATLTNTTKAFYSVNRPPLYNGLIPSTWKAPATSVYDRLADRLYYTIQSNSSLEDFGGDFATHTDANTVPAGGYPRLSTAIRVASTA